jgi:hypothetical protein
LFYSGLRKVETGDASRQDEPWRPGHILHYMQALPFEPTLVVDVSATWSARTEAIQAYSSQFHSPDYVKAEAEPATYISEPGFVSSMDARARGLGYRIGAQYGEGFLYHQGPFGVDDLVSTFAKPRRA